MVVRKSERQNKAHSDIQKRRAAIYLLLIILLLLFLLLCLKSMVSTHSDFDRVQSVSSLHDDNSKIFLTVPYISQFPEYPTGCEIVSATMLLQYFGYSLSVDTMITQYLDTSDITSKGDDLYSGDPNASFIGSPYSIHSYGCFAPVITTSLNRVLVNGQAAINTTGTDLSELITKYIEHNIPVLIWASIDMKETHLTATWINTESGKTVYWPSGEHCLVLVGYDNDNYYFNDPYQNRGTVHFQKEIVEKRFGELKKQSVVISRSGSLPGSCGTSPFPVRFPRWRW